MAKCVGATDFIGGGTGALDAYDGSLFSVGDSATVFKNGQFISYIFVSSSVAEHSPWLIQPDTNGTGVRWKAVEDSSLNIIRSNLTLYLESTGDDTNNTGMTSGSPWKNLSKAIEWLGDKIIIPTVTVTISCNASTIVQSGLCTIIGAQYRNVEIVGQGSSSTTLSWSAAGTGGIKIDKNTHLGDIKNIKLLGNGTAGNGIEVNKGSEVYSSADLLVDSFNNGIEVNNDSRITAASGAISCKNNNASGCLIQNESSGDLQGCLFDNNGGTGLYTLYSSSCLAMSSTSTNNNYGFSASYNSWTNASSSTASGNTTANYSPAKTTANDPTFGNQGSWIYG